MKNVREASISNMSSSVASSCSSSSAVEPWFCPGLAARLPRCGDAVAARDVLVDADEPRDWSDFADRGEADDGRLEAPPALGDDDDECSVGDFGEPGERGRLPDRLLPCCCCFLSCSRSSGAPPTPAMWRTLAHAVAPRCALVSSRALLTEGGVSPYSFCHVEGWLIPMLNAAAAELGRCV